ncbi:hypothetical protein PC118_g17353 [Phytophthora cactorum]|uniref:Uncharacterized protein n=1 Tax=Phytophthora cactorum TaxID=29920 RepID=A0A8T0YLJ3_9STRA|nr:hypothetical protein PC113_g17697 [Phytophthora cactorum]KAG2969605.1 hypothetical protein PC118_g17353 [Phytophthora cactorum]KAG3151846.1 hypothetical protein C6341_g16423 [Phytophthora cactorum]
MSGTRYTVVSRVGDELWEQSQAGATVRGDCIENLY